MARWLIIMMVYSKLLQEIREWLVVAMYVASSSYIAIYGYVIVFFCMFPINDNHMHCCLLCMCISSAHMTVFIWELLGGKFPSQILRLPPKMVRYVINDKS